MKKNISIFLFILILLSSCNFPTKSAEQDSSSIVATRVAQTLIAVPSSTNIVPSLVQSTDVLPTVSLPTITPSQTATLTPTPTTSPADPKIALGTPVYANTFTSGSDFDLASPYMDEAVKLSVHDGVLEFTSLGLNYGRRFQLTYPKPKDFYIEGVFQTVSCSGLDHYGLVMKAPNYFDGYGYYIAFSCSGQYIIQKWDSGGISTINNWSSDSHILAGSSQTNRLGVWIKGNDIKLYANGVLIKELSDSSFSNAGHFGIYGSAVDSGNFDFKVNEISQWNLP